jgi:hypothetical protein
MPDDWIQYLLEHEHDDPIKILLSKKGIFGYSAEFIANQIDCRKRAKEKLPTWYANPEITYPHKYNLEQCSSEIAAKFKSDFIVSTSGLLRFTGNDGSRSLEALIDLTGGFGVDSFFFSKVFKNVIHVEPNENLGRLAKENHERLDARNIEYINQTAEKFLNDFSGQADWIYIDPSRKAQGKKLVRLSDCEPDVTRLLPSIWAKTGQILIKTAPLLDIKEGLRQLPNAAHVVVVSVNNDCKEVLFHLQKDFAGEPEIVCVNVQSEKEERFIFRLTEEVNTTSTFSEPKEFLYEPNASLLKAGAFKKIGQAFNLSKLAVNTHVYTSNKKLIDFPGRVFKIVGDISGQVKLLPDNKVNIISRNHPLSPDDIKKKYKLKDGSDRYVLAFSGEKKKYILVAERVK